MVAYFTSSMNDRALLEAIFTGREALAQQLIDRIRDGIQTGSLHNSLVIGPRGIGKTHLVSLIYYRVKDDAALNDGLRIAWLLEDPYSVSSYARLLREILVQLDREYGITGWPERLAEIEQLSARAGRPAVVEAALEDEIIGFLGRRLLLLIAENLDAIFEGLGDDGQKKLRAFLQQKCRSTLLVTSTSLLPDAEDRGRPFFGFFRPYTLAPFSFEECVDVMVRIARHHGDTQLADLLSSPQGRARVRAIHHIAGGNPRIYVIFYQFLSRDSLDQLVEPIMKLVEDLLPYYQGRMQTLSPQQRMLVDIVRRHESPIAVRDIAKAAFVSSQSASSDLAKLRQLGYVNSTQVGRESLYELREPLMRICLSAKEQRGQTLPLFIEFLRVWFMPSELEGMGPAGAGHAGDYERHRAAIDGARQRQAAWVGFERQRIRDCEAAGETELALELLKNLHARAPDDQFTWLDLRFRLEERAEYDLLARLARERAALFPESAGDWHVLRNVESLRGDHPAALAASVRAVALDPAPWSVAAHLACLRIAGSETERREFAQQFLTQAAAEDDGDDLMRQAICHAALGDDDAAVDRALEAVRADPEDYDKWRFLHYQLGEMWADAARLPVAKLACELFPHLAVAWRDLWAALGVNGDFAEAGQALDRAIEIAPGSMDLVGDNLRWAILSGDRPRAHAAAALVEAMPWQSSRRDAAAAEALAMFQALDGRPEAGRVTLRRVLMVRGEQHRLPDSHSPLAVVRWTSDIGTWKTIAALWVEVYGEHEALPHLGQSLVNNLLREADLPDEVLHRWVETWTAVAVDIPDLALPLHLMDAAARFRQSLDPASLLRLPLEQRTLLQPHIDRYLRRIGKKRHHIDARIEEFVDAERVRMATRRQATLPTPLFDARRRAALLARYRGRLRSPPPLPRLHYGAWSAVPKRAAAALVDALVTSDPQALALLARPDLVLTSIDRTALAFASGHLHQAHVTLDGRPGALDFWADGDRAVVLRGDSADIDRLVAAGAIAPEPGSEPDLIAFVCGSRRGDAGRFRVVTPEDADVTAALAKVRPEVPITVPEARLEEGRHSLRTFVVYDGRLYKVRLDLADRTAGKVEMVQDEAIVDDALDLPGESFEGPLRLLREAADAP